MNDEQMRPLLKAWFQARSVGPADVPDGVAQVVARLPQTRQRGRWWPLPVFDRPVSTFPSRELAPAPIPATNGRQPARGFTMFSAIKFVAAAAIVALFGGFLLAGVLTTQQGDEMAPGAVTESPSPMTTEELLSGMVTEEVEPGVYKVVNDGVRDLALGDGLFRVDVTPDGSVWLSGIGDGQDLFHLGEERVFEGPTGYPHFWEVAPDGSLWTLGEVSDFNDGIFSFDGEGWTERATTTDFFYTFAVGPDGTVWVMAIDEDKHCPDVGADECRGTTLLRLGDDGSLTTIEDWSDVHDGDAYSLAVSPDGDVWTVSWVGETEDGTEFAGTLLRFDGEGWEAIPGPEGRAPGGYDWLASGPDGTLWVDVSGDVNRGALARYDAAGWTTFTDADGVEPWHDTSGYWGYMMPPAVAADGSLWLERFEGHDCDGAVHFDGTTWTSYLEEYCISDLAIAPDGSVWLGAEAYDYDSSLYVITPEPVAATEVTDIEVATTTTSDVLPGVTLAVEEVETGVFCVVDDGVRDVKQVHMTAVGDDGSVWVDSAKGILALGRPGEHPGLVDGEGFLVVAGDGTLWAESGDGHDGPAELRSFDGETWTRQGAISDGIATVPDPWWPADYILDFAVHPDGSVWQVGANVDAPDAYPNLQDAYPRLQHLDADTWTTYVVGEGLPNPGWCDLCVEILGCECDEGWDIEITPDGTVWVGIQEAGLLRFDGTDWEVIRPLGDDQDHAVAGLASNRDGVLWAEFESGHLARFDGRAWGAVSHVPAPEGDTHRARSVDPDGNLWVGSYSHRWGGYVSDGCDGIRRFDGSTWMTFLAGECVTDIDIASDGAVWVTVPSRAGPTWVPGDLYVITPEAVATTE